MKRILIAVLVMFSMASIYAQQFPFPYNNGKAVNSDALVPEGKTIDDLNNDVKVFYDQWKSGGKTPWGADASGYLREDKDTGFWYLAAASTNPEYDTPTEWKNMSPALYQITHSEGHGYAMIIVAVMAGHDPEAKKIFDGLVDTYLAYQSKVTEWPEDKTKDPIIHESSGMSWLIPNDLDNPDVKREGGAADGDMDIAYALLLANGQWGNNGRHKYLDLAKEMLGNDTGLLKFTLSKRTNRILSGNWMHFKDNGRWNATESENRFNHTQSRPSDWMVDHLRAFDKYLPDSRWQLAIDEIYNMIPQVQSVKGLFPDFMEDRPNDNGTIKPQPVHVHNVTDHNGITKMMYLEGENDDKFSHNACRVPLRLAMDYLTFGSEDSKKALQKLNTWTTTLNTKPDEWMTSTWPGYDLEGNKIPQDDPDYTLDGAYYAPMIASMIAGLPAGNSTNVNSYLGHAWDDMKNRFLGNHTELVYDAATNKWSPKVIEQPWGTETKNWTGYYGDTLTMLSMLVVSQNYWNPVTAIKPEGNVVNVTKGTSYSTLQAAINASGSGDVLEVTKAYDGVSSGVQVNGKSNLTIVGIDTDEKRPELVGSRYGHALAIVNSSNITIKNLLLQTGIGRLYIDSNSSDIKLNDMYISGGMGEAAILNGKNITITDSVLIGSFAYLSANVSVNNAQNLKMYRNVVYRGNGPGIDLEGTKGAEIYNNTIVDSKFGIDIDAACNGIKIKNNIFYQNDGGVLVTGKDMALATDVTVAYNLAYKYGNDPNAKTYSLGSNLIEKDPLLAKGAVLQNKSAAINKGVIISGVTDHVIDGKPDLGAKEADFAVTAVSREWNPSSAYSTGDEAAVDGRPYIAKWWNNGNFPESAEFSPWEADYKEFLPSEYSESKVYLKGEEVQYGSKFYRAKWWTQGGIPDAQWGDWEEIVISPFIHE